MNNFSYAIFPLFLLNDEKYKDLSCKEFFLYMLLLNRSNFSKKNLKRFSDKKGIFVYYSNTEIVRDLRCSLTTAVTLIKRLEDVGLIHKENQKNGLPRKIYVYDIRESTNKPNITKKADASFDIEKAKEQSKTNKHNFGELKNPKIRHKKTT